MRNLAHPGSASKSFSKAELSPAQWFDLLHGHHDGGVWIATDGEFHKGGPRNHQQAAIAATDLVLESDCYMTMNAVAGWRRVAKAVTAHTSLWVDLDYYKTSHADLSPRDLYRTIRDREKWLPTPSMLVESGRGVYLVWALETPLPSGRQGTWRTAEAALVELLREYGADPAAKAASQWLRIPGTIHSGAGEVVRAYQLGERVRFSTVKRAVSAERRRRGRGTGRNATVVALPGPKTEVTADTGVEAEFVDGTAPVMWNARLEYVLKVLRSRAPLEDGRRRARQVLSVALSWTCANRGLARHRLEQAIRETFADAERYMDPAQYENLLFARGDDRHKMKDTTIMALLAVTGSEARTFGTVTAWRRRDERPAMRTQAEWAAEREVRQRRVLELHDEGYTVSRIAALVGVDRRTVRRDLSPAESSGRLPVYTPPLSEIGVSASVDAESSRRPDTGSESPALNLIGLLPDPTVLDLPISTLPFYLWAEAGEQPKGARSIAGRAPPGMGSGGLALA